MPMGPYQMADLAGIDIGWHREPNRIENIRDKLCAMERWGQKKGAGFYDYDDKRRPSPSPVVAEVIEEFRQKAGIEKREITDQANMERTIYTMVNERSEGRRVGKECVSTCRSWGLRDHLKKKNT